MPPHVFVKSVHNITRERAWRPLYENELSAVQHEWLIGKLTSGFCPENPIHKYVTRISFARDHPNDDTKLIHLVRRGVSLWLWGRVVQDRLDSYRNETNKHRIRKQKKIHIPSGGRPHDFFHKPHKWGGKTQFISIPDDDLWFIDKLIEKHANLSVLQFGTDDIAALALKLYTQVGTPHLDAKSCWGVFSAMIALYNEVVANIE